MKDWLGRQRKEEDELGLGQVRRLAAMLDQDPSRYRRGTEVPESWYTILFGPTALQQKIAPDGHPLTGGDDLMPPMHNTRRMFAGRRVKFLKPLKVGDLVERVSTIHKVEPKTGRTGSFTLVTVMHEMSAGAGAALHRRHHHAQHPARRRQCGDLGRRSGRRRALSRQHRVQETVGLFHVG